MNGGQVSNYLTPLILTGSLDQGYRYYVLNFGVTSPPPTDSLIPNGDGVGKTDWVVTGGGLFDTNLADYWHGANYNNPM